MFGVAAVIAFLLALLHVSLGPVDLVVLGLLFLALHVTVGPVIALPFATRRTE